MTETNQNTATEQAKKQDLWFESMINSIRVDWLQIQTKTASEEKTGMYNNLMEGNSSEILSEMRNSSSKFFIEELVKEYIIELNSGSIKINKLAFDLSDAKVLVWAEIDDSDDTSEDGLILAEAKTNARFFKHGLHISSTIIEKGDQLSIPPHYYVIKD